MCLSTLQSSPSTGLSECISVRPLLPQGKVGVTMTKKRSANQESSFSSYLHDLRSRCDTLAQTPVKRLKVKKNTEYQMKVLSQSR